ncbi:MAG: type IV-A pilus assembly ATPase PilB [Burkholderiales bacterium]|nr:type IV-A pilus assembly ATPase PilB [Burkholderiales bacterium]
MNNGIITTLLQNKLINKDDISQIKDLMISNSISCVEAIAFIKYDLSEEHIMNSLSLFSGIPLFDIRTYCLERLPTTNLSSTFILAYKVLPIELYKNQLTLAVVYPLSKELCTQISFITGYSISLVLANEKHLMPILNLQSNSLKINENHNTNDVDFISDGNKIFTEDWSINSESDDKPVAKFVHRIIYDAVKLGASDIHFEPYEKNYRIRYRIDGVLTEASTPSLELKDKIITRIKVVAKIDIAEKRVPQDGRLRLQLESNQTIDFRVSTLPTVFGEKAVLRILNRNAATLNIGELGLDDNQQQILLDAIKRPYGMILVTGPTGSGKTVTLYSILNLLNESSRNISTIEDPIEIPISGINQVAVNEKTNLDFSTALRAFLRQDPDVIMVGEIRDFETASMAVKAAQTGHLVLSTLHTNDAAASLTRLLNLGVPIYNIGDAILLIVAERLVRKLCRLCKQRGEYSVHELINAGFTELEISGGFMPYIATGCEYCNYSGYKGRVGIFEVMPIDDEIKVLILNHANSATIKDIASKNGVNSLRRSGLDKVKHGITSLTEIEAHINC